MENVEPNFLATEEFNNWINLSVAVRITCVGISEYLKTEVGTLHNNLKYSHCGGLSNCTDNCSQTKTSLSAWCNTCKIWKKELLTLVKHNKHKQNIKWQNVSSGKWPTDIEEVVKVFAPHWWNNQKPFWEDLTVGLSIIHNCNVFTLPKPIYLDVGTVRNNFCAHSYLTVTNNDYENSMKTVLELLKYPEVLNTKAGHIAIQQIKELQNNKLTIDANRQNQFDLLRMNVIFEELKGFQNDLRFIRKIKHRLEKDTNGEVLLDGKQWKRKCLNGWTFMFTLLFIPLFFSLGYWQFFESDHPTKMPGMCYIFHTSIFHTSVNIYSKAKVRIH